MDVKVLRTNDTWYGMTYKEDVMAVRDSFKEMFEKGIYKADLFSDLWYTGAMGNHRGFMFYITGEGNIVEAGDIESAWLKNWNKTYQKLRKGERQKWKK